MESSFGLMNTVSQGEELMEMASFVRRRGRAHGASDDAMSATVLELTSRHNLLFLIGRVDATRKTERRRTWWLPGARRAG
jgi:hypothetical protein